MRGRAEVGSADLITCHFAHTNNGRHTPDKHIIHNRNEEETESVAQHGGTLTSRSGDGGMQAETEIQRDRQADRNSRCAAKTFSESDSKFFQVTWQSAQAAHGHVSSILCICCPALPTVRCLDRSRNVPIGLDQSPFY